MNSLCLEDAAFALKAVCKTDVYYSYSDLNEDQQSKVMDLVRAMHDVSDFNEFTDTHWIDSFLGMEIMFDGRSLIAIKGATIVDDEQKTLGFAVRRDRNGNYRMLFSQSGKCNLSFFFILKDFLDIEEFAQQGR